MSRYIFDRGANASRFLVVAVSAAFAVHVALASTTPASAQDQQAPAANPSTPADAQKKRHHPKKPAEVAPPAAAAPSANAPQAAEAAAPLDPMVAQLAKAGVKTCLSGMTALGRQTMGGVTGYARAANWQTKTPDDRLASVILGQSYADKAPLPKAFAMLFGAPSGKSKCDGYAIQVIPTVEKCSALQTKITIRGKKLGDLSGIPFLTDVNGSQVLLLPGAGDSCVLVGIRIDYAD